MMTVEENGTPAWLVQVLQRCYTVELLREWIHRADTSGWHEPRYTKRWERNGQRDRWGRALAILEGGGE